MNAPLLKLSVFTHAETRTRLPASPWLQNTWHTPARDSTMPSWPSSRTLALPLWKTVESRPTRMPLNGGSEYSHWGPSPSKPGSASKLGLSDSAGGGSAGSGGGVAASDIHLPV